MLYVKNPLNEKYSDIILPDNTFIATMKQPEVLEAPKAAIREALDCPISSASLKAIAEKKKEAKKDATAVIVVSDNTRPVPYKGENGILVPVVETLLEAGYTNDQITVLVATGMHRPMREDELKTMLDGKIFDMGIKVVNHEPKNDNRLEFVGTTKRGTKAMIDTIYTSADLKILTGLVESHFMAGASGGRKAVCPGVIGEESTYIFHGPELMDDNLSKDLQIEGNPVHEESLAVAKLAGVDFIVNVTLDHDFNITGVFAGDLEKAHLAAVEKIRESVEVKVPEADLVITHGGFVGINHYQCAKCAVASLGALKKDGYLISIADITDGGHPIGSVNYRVTLTLLHLLGSEAFVKLLNSPDWVFLPEQWQVQQWAKVFRKTPQDHYYFYAPQIGHEWFDSLPGNDIRVLFDGNEDESNPNIYQIAIEKAIQDVERRTGKKREELVIVYLKDGPYEVPRS